MSIEKMDATGRTVDGKKHTASLEHAVKFVGWPTPDTGIGLADSTWETRRAALAEKYGNNGFGLTLGQASSLAGWATPTTRDHKDTGDLSASMTRKDGKSRNDTVPRQVFGLTSNGSPAATGSIGQLNPAFSLWLMGYPAECISSGVRAMQSFPTSRRRS